MGWVFTSLSGSEVGFGRRTERHVQERSKRVEGTDRVSIFDIMSTKEVGRFIRCSKN